MARQTPTVFVEQATILQRREYPHRQRTLRLHAPRCAKTAKPGQFVHLQCDSDLKMRRPYSIMLASASRGWIEILYRVVGRGSRLLDKKRQEEKLSLVGPIGHGFSAHDEYPRPLLLGGGVGIPPVLFLAKSLGDHPGFSPLVIFASERAFPFPVCESQIAVDGLDARRSLTHAGLESAGITARLCSKQSHPGCFDGFAHEIADAWLSGLGAANRTRTEIFACGPHPMLRAVASLALKYTLPCQLALEEYMACGLGGCAGCTVATVEHGRISMKRICVDGPVFDASSLQL